MRSIFGRARVTQRVRPPSSRGTPWMENDRSRHPSQLPLPTTGPPDLPGGRDRGKIWPPSMPIADHIRLAQVVLPCPDLAATLRFFTDELGFKVNLILPAD